MCHIGKRHFFWIIEVFQSFAYLRDKYAMSVLMCHCIASGLAVVLDGPFLDLTTPN